MSKIKKGWQPPSGYIAVQTYVPGETHAVLELMRQYNGRSLRSELRLILNEKAREWAAKHRAND